DVSKGRSCPGHDHKIARSADEITFNSLQLVPRQLLPKPDNTGSHECIAFRTSGNDIFLLVLLLAIASPKITTRTPTNENVSVTLHQLFLQRSRTRVQVVHILCDEQELACVLGQFSNRGVSCVRFRVADALAPFAVPFPNQFRIARERFRRSQLCRIEIPPVPVLPAKSWDAAFSGNASAS